MVRSLGSFEFRGDLNERIRVASAGNGWLRVLADGNDQCAPWAEVYEMSCRVMSWLHGQGLGPGSRILLYGRTSLDMVVAIESAWLAGLSVTFVSPPIRSRRRSQTQQRREAICRSLQPDLILVDDTLSGDIASSACCPVVELSRWRRGWQAERPAIPAHVDRTALVVAQPTSGTTGRQKAVRVPRRCLEVNHQSMARRLALDSDDVFVSWLPLSHDMGLVGMLGLPMVTGASLVVADREQFIQQPAAWMDWCSKFRGTLTAAPSFAYGIASKLLQYQDDLDLSSLRYTVSGSEQIRVDAFESFLGAAAERGLDRSSALSVYGMAEATLGVTFPEPGTGLQWDTVTSPGRRARSIRSTDRRLALLGRSLDGLELEVRPHAGSIVDREVGEIHIRGSSMTPGYLDDVEERGSGTWFATGDLGYLVDGELVVCGRTKELIVIGGRNYYPADLEESIYKVPGIRYQNVAAFSVTGRHSESLVIVAEVADDTGAAHTRREIVNAIRDDHGIRPSDVRLIPPGAMHKTPSGKVSRSACRDEYLDASGGTR